MQKITKHASKGTNYAILTKQVKVQHKKKPVSNLKSMQMVVSKYLRTLRRFSFYKNNFFVVTQ